MDQEVTSNPLNEKPSDLAEKPVVSTDSARLRSQASTSVPALLSQLRTSILVSTYQAGFAVILRAEAPERLNTHFRHFKRPMGLALNPRTGRLALGVEGQIIEFRNMADVGRRLQPPERHDACYLPRSSHVTGRIDIHEMAWADPLADAASPEPTADKPTAGTSELWFVNTKFSCLCTLDDEHSFVPRWWPPFVSSLGLEDRCHLNGLGMVGGKPRYVTALGATDQANGWRENKAHGGVLLDVDSGEVLLQGLSMPHSPRWYDGRLWLLESGEGTLGMVDLAKGKYEPFVQFEGFTRGLAFWGRYALVGLSQLRESAVFSGIALVDRVKERKCGVAIVDLRAGRQVGFVHFQDAVQEVFAVEWLPHRYPELLEPSDELVGSSYALPRAALTHVGRAPAMTPDAPARVLES